jgi:hypothetical protein
MSTFTIYNILKRSENATSVDEAYKTERKTTDCYGLSKIYIDEDNVTEKIKFNPKFFLGKTLGSVINSEKRISKPVS